MTNSRILLGLIGALLIAITLNVLLATKMGYFEEESNVGNGEVYVYEITDISEREMNGIPLNKESDGNRGIMLYKDEVPFEVKLGDKIAVVWGEYEDEFASIERAVQAEDGSYVSEKFYE